jgi:hypothetical protein
VAGIRLGSGESARAFKGIICDDISEFESYMPSHAVGLPQVRSVLRDIARDVAQAEDQTNLKFDEERGREIPHPSALRSETGAIERIDMYGPQDRRSFSLEEGLSWLANPVTGSSYEIELFDVPPPRNQWDGFDEGRQRAYVTFVDGLSAMGQGLAVQRQFFRDQAQPLLSVRLSRSTAPPTLQLGPPIPVERRGERELAPFDGGIERHRRLLRFLDNHPLVRHVDLPPVIVRTPDGLRLSGQSAATSAQNDVDFLEGHQRVKGVTSPLLMSPYLVCSQVPRSRSIVLQENSGHFGQQLLHKGSGGVKSVNWTPCCPASSWPRLRILQRACGEFSSRSTL